jgi:hypothetical protein
MIRVATAASRVIGALRFPNQDSVLYIDIPGARTGAVDTMGGANLFIILPPPPIIVLPFTLSASDFGPTMGECFDPFGSEKEEGREKIFFVHHDPPQ